MKSIFLPAMLALTTAAVGLPALADVLPPEAANAMKRLLDNPRAFDRTDEYCKDKTVGEACVLPGNTFAGGGEGVCKNEFNRAEAVIDLSCVRERAVIDRKLPEGGFVNDEYLCREVVQAQRDGVPMPSEWNCTPLKTPPRDQFCAGKDPGAACTVALLYQGVREQFPGVCKEETQTQGFYYQGHRKATRQVVQCQPREPLPPRSYTPVGWWQKLMQ